MHVVLVLLMLAVLVAAPWIRRTRPAAARWLTPVVLVLITTNSVGRWALESAFDRVLDVLLVGCLIYSVMVALRGKPNEGRVAQDLTVAPDDTESRGRG